MPVTDPSDPGRELGFAGMLAAGMTPAEAWQLIRADLTASPEARAIYAGLETDPDGRAALAWSRAQWAAKGLPAPFDDLPD